MAQQIQLRNDTTAGWAYANPVLTQAEVGVDTTLGKFKIGDGVSTWDELEFQSASIADFVFAYDDMESESSITVVNHDMIIRTTRTAGQDADIDINSADDVWITAGDEIEIDAGDDIQIRSDASYVRIVTDRDDSGNEWTFQTDGRLRFPDGTLQTTAYTGADSFSPLPSFLDYTEGRLHLPILNTNFGWDSFGLWFGNEDGGEGSYPVFTDFVIGENDAVIVEFNVNVQDECSDMGMCIYLDGTIPEWNYGADSTRIAAQFNCQTLELNGLVGQAVSLTNIPGTGMYHIRFTYIPAGGTKALYEIFSGTNTDNLVTSLTLNEVLGAGNYRVGFAADNGDARTYMSDLSITINEGVPYTDTLQNGNSGSSDLVIPVRINDDNGAAFITFTRTNTGTARIETPQDDLSLRSARDITLIAGDDGPGNVYIGWGDATITPDATNRVATIADVTAATGLGDITFDGVQIVGGGTASSDGLGNGTIRLVPDADQSENDQFLVIEPTQPGIQGAPGHIHLRAGGTIDESNADLILGGERNSVVVSDTEKEIKVSTAFRSKLYFTNLNSNSGTQFIVSETANILVGDTVYVGNSGESYIVDAVTSFDEGLVAVTAEGVTFGAGSQYLFTREESYNNGWAFGSDGVFSGPYMGGGVVVTGLVSTQTDDLYIQSPNNDIIINAISGNIILDGGASGTDVYIDSDSLENKVATLSDFGGITLENRVISTLDDGEDLRIRVTDGLGSVAAEILLDEGDGSVALRGTRNSNALFTDSDWTTATWTGTTITLTGALTVGTGLDNIDGVIVGIQIGSGAVASLVNYNLDEAGDGSINVGTDVGSETVTVSSLNVIYSFTSLIRVDQDDYEDILIYGNQIPVLIQSTEDINIQSGNDHDIYLSPGSGGKIFLQPSAANAYIGTENAGNRIARIVDLATIRTSVPATSLGLEGHVIGMVADDATHHYYCTANYDGTTHIWKRVAWINETWGV
jgi:hypothetical protein